MVRDGEEADILGCVDELGRDLVDSIVKVAKRDLLQRLTIKRTRPSWKEIERIAHDLL